MTTTDEYKHGGTVPIHHNFKLNISVATTDEVLNISVATTDDNIHSGTVPTHDYSKLKYI